MKSILFLTLFVGFTAASASDQYQIHCDDTDGASVSAIRSRPEDPGAYGKLFLHHNYSSSTLQCDMATLTAVQKRRPFRCAGLWVFDGSRPDLTVGTVAVVDFMPKGRKTWVALFTTSHDYGRRDLTMECEIKLLKP